MQIPEWIILLGLACTTVSIGAQEGGTAPVGLDDATPDAQGAQGAAAASATQQEQQQAPRLSFNVEGVEGERLNYFTGQDPEQVALVFSERNGLSPLNEMTARIANVLRDNLEPSELEQLLPQKELLMLVPVNVATGNPDDSLRKAPFWSANDPLSFADGFCSTFAEPSDNCKMKVLSFVNERLEATKAQRPSPIFSVSLVVNGKETKLPFFNNDNCISVATRFVEASGSNEDVIPTIVDALRKEILEKGLDTHRVVSTVSVENVGSIRLFAGDLEQNAARSFVAMHSLKADGVPRIEEALQKYKEDTLVKPVAILPFRFEEGRPDEVVFYEGDTEQSVALRYAMSRSIPLESHPTVLKVLVDTLEEQRQLNRERDTKFDILKAPDAVFEKMIFERPIQIASMDHTIRVYPGENFERISEITCGIFGITDEENIKILASGLANISPKEPVPTVPRMVVPARLLGITRNFTVYEGDSHINVARRYAVNWGFTPKQAAELAEILREAISTAIQASALSKESNIEEDSSKSEDVSRSEGASDTAGSNEAPAEDSEAPAEDSEARESIEASLGGEYSALVKDYVDVFLNHGNYIIHEWIPSTWGQFCTWLQDKTNSSVSLPAEKEAAWAVSIIGVVTLIASVLNKSASNSYIDGTDNATETSSNKKKVQKKKTSKKSASSEEEDDDDDEVEAQEDTVSAKPPKAQKKRKPRSKSRVR